MTKAELLNSVTSKVENMSKKQTAEVVDAVFAALAEAINVGERFSYPGFGTFSVKPRAAREGRNPRTGAPIKIKASKTVGFKPAPKLKDMINGSEKDKKAEAKKAPAKKADKADAKKASAKKSKK